jgi:hypothetical protein
MLCWEDKAEADELFYKAHLITLSLGNKEIKEKDISQS